MSGDWREGKTTEQCLAYLCLKETLSDLTFVLRDVSSDDDQVEDSMDQAGGQQRSPASRADRTRFPAHKFVLAIKSEVFEAMFYGKATNQSDTEIQIDDVEEGTFKELLEYIYTDKATIDASNVLKCLHAARKYGVNGLVKLCTDFLENSIGIDNACTLFDQSSLYELDDLRDRCLKVMSDNAPAVFASRDFLTLSSASLAALFSVDTLEVNEVKIFEAALRWARGKFVPGGTAEGAEREPSGEELRSLLGKALFQIRFPLMAVEDYTDQVVPSGILTMEEQLQLYVYMTKKDEKLDKVVGEFQAVSRQTSLQEVEIPGTPENLYVVRIKGCVVTFTFNKPVNIHRLMFDPNFKHHVKDGLSIEIVSTDGSKPLLYDVDSLTPGKIIFPSPVRVQAGVQCTIRVKFDKTVSVMSCGTQLKMPFTINSHGINVSWSSWSPALKSIFISKL